MNNLLNQFEELLELQSVSQFQKAKRGLASGKASQSEVLKYREIVFNIISKRILSDKRIANYLSTSKRSDIEGRGMFIRKEDFGDENLATGMFAMMFTDAYAAMVEYYLDELKPSLEDLTKQTSCLLAQEALNDYSRANLAGKKKIYVDALGASMEALRIKAQVNARDRYKSGEATSKHLEGPAAKRISHLIILSNEAIDKLNSTKPIEVHAFKAELERLISLESKLAKMVELKKENAPLKTGNTSLPNNQISRRNVDLARQENSIKPFDENKGIVERKSPSGKIDDPLALGEGDKKNKKKVWMWVAGGLAVVGIFAGAYYLGKNSNKNVVGPIEPTTSDGVLESPDVLESYPIEYESAPVDESFMPDVSSEPIESNQVAESSAPVETLVPIEDVKAELDTAIDSIHANWTAHGVDVSKEQVGEIIKVLNGYESTCSLGEADDYLTQILNTTIFPIGENKASLDFSSLILGNKSGVQAVETMEGYLNGCLTDFANARSYSEKAFYDEVLILGLGQEVDGLDVLGDTKTDAGVRLIWSRLTLGVNSFMGIYGDELSVEMTGVTYVQSDINDGTVLEEIANKAKKELGSNDKILVLQ